MRKNSLAANNSPARGRQYSPGRRLYNLSKQRQVLQEMYRDKFQETIYMKSKIVLLQKSLLASKELNKKYEDQIGLHKEKAIAYTNDVQKLHLQVEESNRKCSQLVSQMQGKEGLYMQNVALLEKDFNDVQKVRNQELKHIELQFVRNELFLTQRLSIAEREIERVKSLKTGEVSCCRPHLHFLEQVKMKAIKSPNAQRALVDIQRLLQQVKGMEQAEVNFHLEKQELLKRVDERINRFCINYLNRGQVVLLPLNSTMDIALEGNRRA